MQYLDPIVQAVSAEQFRDATHLAGDADATMDDLLIAAQEVVETACAISLSPRSCRFELPEVPWTCWWLPVRPLVAVTAIETRAADATDWVAADLAEFLARAERSEPHLRRVSPATGDPVGTRITATVGYDGDAPQQVRQAIILMAKEWHDAGIRVDDLGEVKLSMGIDRLIRQVRYRRACVWG